jgi:hypothetical protein
MQKIQEKSAIDFIWIAGWNRLGLGFIAAVTDRPER